MSHPTYTQQEALARKTFLALMWSLSYPGRTYDLPTTDLNNLQLIGDTLLDLETSFYTPDNDLATYFEHNGTRKLTPDRAAYHFYPVLTEAQLTAVKQANVGTLMYPDQSATLIIGCRFGTGEKLALTGPGIPPNETNSIAITGIPNQFWQLRDSANRYPRGWDIYLISDTQVIGLPRTTQIMPEV